MSSFGAARPRLRIVGLTPGLRGAKRTGRSFSGDHAGILRYETLHAASLPTAPCYKRLRSRLVTTPLRMASKAIR